MRLAILGATGRTGRALLDQALAAGHEVTALARVPARMGPPRERLTVVTGNVFDAPAVARTVEGADVLISALGPSKGSPKDLFTRSTPEVLRAARAAGVKRFVTVAGAAVTLPGDEKGRVAAAFSTLVGLAAGVGDRQRELPAIQAGGIDWVVVRPPRLTEGPVTGQYREGSLQLGPQHKIARADVAHFMLRQIGEDTYVRQAPFIAY